MNHAQIKMVLTPLRFLGLIVAGVVSVACGSGQERPTCTLEFAVRLEMSR